MTTVPAGPAGTNYRLNQGYNILYSGIPAPVQNATGMPPADGPFWDNSTVKLTDITDGTSNTAAMSEQLKGDFSNAIVTNRTDTFLLDDYPNTPDWWNASCDSLDITDLSRQGNSDVGQRVDRGVALELGLLPHQPAEQAVVQVADAAGSRRWPSSMPHRRGERAYCATGRCGSWQHSITLAAWRAARQPRQARSQPGLNRRRLDLPPATGERPCVPTRLTLADRAPRSLAGCGGLDSLPPETDPPGPRGALEGARRLEGRRHAADLKNGTPPVVVHDPDWAARRQADVTFELDRGGRPGRRGPVLATVTLDSSADGSRPRQKVNYVVGDQLPDRRAPLRIERP